MLRNSTRSTAKRRRDQKQERKAQKATRPGAPERGAVRVHRKKSTNNREQFPRTEGVSFQPETSRVPRRDPPSGQPALGQKEWSPGGQGHAEGGSRAPEQPWGLEVNAAPRGSASEESGDPRRFSGGGSWGRAISWPQAEVSSGDRACGGDRAEQTCRRLAPRRQRGQLVPQSGGRRLQVARRSGSGCPRKGEGRAGVQRCCLRTHLIKLK